MTDTPTLPSCIHRPACDGCPWFERPTDLACEDKVDALREQLGFYLGLAPKPADIVPSPETLGYRNRARMVVHHDAKDPKHLLGFYKRGSRTLLPIKRCVAHEPHLEQALHHLRTTLFAQKALRAATRFVDARALEDRIIVTLCTGAPTGEDLAQWKLDAQKVAAHLALACEHAVGVRLNVGTKGQSIGSGQDIEVAAPSAFEQPLDEQTSVEVPPQAFFQLNTQQLQRTHEIMRSWFEQPPTLILDLYCGIGVHGLALAQKGAKIWGADLNEASIEAARRNAQRNGVDGVYTAASDKRLAPWLAEHLPERVDVALINPGRAGMHPSLLPALDPARMGALVVLSCQPQTLARDLDRLRARGWRVSRVQPLDYMPRTPQVETLVMLTPQQRDIRASSDGAYWPVEGRQWPLGVSGTRAPTGPQTHTSWLAFVHGRPPAHGQLPQLKDTQHSEITATRVLLDGRNTWIRIDARDQDPRHIMQRLRAWGYPVLGDTTFGNKGANRWFAKAHFGDRPAIHCVDIYDGPTLVASCDPPGELRAWGFEEPQEVEEFQEPQEEAFE